MRLGSISDIHLDVNKQYPIVELLAEEIERRKVQGIILAGDISNGPKASIAWLQKMRNRFSVPMWFVPGNHDMWDVEGKFRDSWEIYHIYEKEEGCLCNHPVAIGERLLIGNIGWYDYSFGDASYTIADFQKKKHQSRVWQDSIYIRWKKDDQDMAEIMRTELEQLIATNKGKQILSVTHMLGIPEFKVPVKREGWDYFNAFLGNQMLGNMYEKAGISGAVMGHVHYRKRLLKNNVDYVCACLNYHTEWSTEDPKKEVSQALQEIEL